jgi:dihydrofolate reductase
MRKVIVSCYMTLDGVIENPMWTLPYWGDDIAKFQTDDLFSSDALLLGRKTYEGFAEAWSARKGADAFADRINELPKYIATLTLHSAEWNSTVLKGDVPSEVAKLKQQPGMNILKYGGGELLGTLVQHNLLDELHVLVYPLTVGGGTRLFPDGVESKLKLADTRVFNSGVIALIYQPAESQ